MITIVMMTNGDGNDGDVGGAPYYAHGHAWSSRF